MNIYTEIDYVLSTCPKCNSPIPNEKKGNKFCSRSCANGRIHSKETLAKISNGASISNRNRIPPKKPRKVIQCIICERDIEVISTFKGNKLCGSQICKATNFSNNGKINASKRCKRSKQEIQLFELCKGTFKVEHNKQIANGWDADILLMDHKIAILWNGPWHYKEMGFSNHSLDQVVTRDCIKIQEFETIGWKVLIYQDNQWTPETAFIDILLKVKSW